MRRYVVALRCAAGFKLRDTLAIQQQPGDLVFRGLHRGSILTRVPRCPAHMINGQRIGFDAVDCGLHDSGVIRIRITHSDEPVHEVAILMPGDGVFFHD